MANISRILHHDDDVAAAMWRDVFITIWRHNTTIEGIDICRRMWNSVKSEFTKGSAMITIVEPAAPMPPTEARDELSAFLRSWVDKAKVSAIIYEGAGFRAAAVRSVVTGISLVAKPPFPHKVFATVAAAAAWMAPNLPEGPTASRDMVQAIADIREDLARLSGEASSATSAS